ncbi:MAG: DUF262 domain-containing protein [Oscillospiraceae bacterium]|jgi:hypothetical protein|nr:DUF262 domain-containing protein [Oscillospiraceae bacterium]
MAIKSNLEKHTVSWLKRQDAEGKLNKNISIQRKEVWDAEKKSNLIVSLLLDIPIESLLFEEAEGESHNVLDGKQRTLTLCAFVSDEFAFSPKIRVKALDGQSLAGLKFSMLPEALQNQILEYELSISILRSLDAEERATVFFMRNQAVALSKIDLSLVMLGEEAMDAFARLCEHNFMQTKIKLTAPARRKHDDLRILLQYLILCKRVSMGFSGTEIMSFCDDIKNSEEKLEEGHIQAVLDYLDAAIEEKRQYLKLVHLPMVLLVAKQAREKEMPCDEFAARLDAFFEGLDENGEYMAACKSGSAKRGNVQTRVTIMEDAVLGRKAKK